MNAFGGVGFSTGHFKTKYHLGVTLFKVNILSSDLSWVFIFHVCTCAPLGSVDSTVWNAGSRGVLMTSSVSFLQHIKKENQSNEVYIVI